MITSPEPQYNFKVASHIHDPADQMPLNIVETENRKMAANSSRQGFQNKNRVAIFAELDKERRKLLR